MSSGFVKLDSAILTSSLWIDRDMRSVFITALLMAEPREVKEPTPEIAIRSLERTGWEVPPGWYGFVPAAGVGIVYRDGAEREAGMAALERLAAPDPDSRSEAFSGRRMVRVDGGFIILNYFAYRDRDYGAAERMRAMRQRQKAQREAAGIVTGNSYDGDVTDVTPPPESDVTIRIADADADADAESKGQRTNTPAAPARDLAAIARTFAKPANALAMLKGMTEGLGAPGMKPVPVEVLLEASQEIAVSGGDVTPHRFKGFVRKILERGNAPPEKQYPPRNGQSSTRESRSHAALESYLAKSETTDAEVVTDGEH